MSVGHFDDSPSNIDPNDLIKTKSGTLTSHVSESKISENDEEYLEEEEEIMNEFETGKSGAEVKKEREENVIKEEVAEIADRSKTSAYSKDSKPIMMVAELVPVRAELSASKLFVAPTLSQEEKLKILTKVVTTSVVLLIDSATDMALDDISRNIMAAPPSKIFKKATCSLLEERKTPVVYRLSSSKFPWPHNGKFRGSSGLKTLESFIESWNRHPMWRFYINELGVREESLERIYKYEVTWLCSTRRKPVPKVATNVYFIITVSKIPMHRKEPVDVYYYYEGQRSIHRDVGTCNLCGNTLKGILDNKLYEMNRLLNTLSTFRCI